jgi:tripartite-type tricarboxylate transporter receptor subunit TctC
LATLPLAAIAGRAVQAQAQPAFPDRPVRIIVAFPAGTVTDTLFRNLAEPMARDLGQPVIIENRPGGNGVVGTEAGARAPADGHTLTVLSITNGALNPYLIRRLAYHPLRDFTPVGFVAETAYLLVVPGAHPARDLAGFVDLARRRPGELTFSYGNSSAHICSATLASMAHIEMTGIPYRGGPEALTDVIAERIDSTFTDIAAAMPQLREGKIRALAITTPNVFPLLPEVPPVASLLPGYAVPVWFGTSVPAATPAAVVARLNQSLNRALTLPEVAERLARLGYVPRPGTPEAFGILLAQQIDFYTAKAREVGLEIQ